MYFQAKSTLKRNHYRNVIRALNQDISIVQFPQTENAPY
jgi:hypothetical protein